MAIIFRAGFSLFHSGQPRSVKLTPKVPGQESIEY